VLFESQGHLGQRKGGRGGRRALKTKKEETIRRSLTKKTQGDAVSAGTLVTNVLLGVRKGGEGWEKPVAADA